MESRVSPDIRIVPDFGSEMLTVLDHVEDFVNYLATWTAGHVDGHTLRRSGLPPALVSSALTSAYYDLRPTLRLSQTGYLGGVTRAGAVSWDWDQPCPELRVVRLAPSSVRLIQHAALTVRDGVNVSGNPVQSLMMDFAAARGNQPSDAGTKVLGQLAALLTAYLRSSHVESVLAVDVQRQRGESVVLDDDQAESWIYVSNALRAAFVSADRPVTS